MARYPSPNRHTSFSALAIGSTTALALTLTTLAPTASAAPSSGAEVVSEGRLAGLRFHVVQPGDTLASIAASYGVSTDQLRRANGMTNDVVYEGYRVLIDNPNPRRSLPSGAAATPSADNGSLDVVSHTIRSGETLSTIASRYNTSVAVVRWINSLANPNLITAGDTLAVLRNYHVGSNVSANSASSGGGLVCPVRGASFTYDWGNSRAGGTRFHEGLDLMAPTGTPVRAMTSGVVEAGSGGSAGKWVALRGDDGWQYYGAHLDSITATGRVNAGDVIGTVGTSGNAAGGAAHLHLEIRPINGRPTNPLPVVRSVC